MNHIFSSNDFDFETSVFTFLMCIGWYINLGLNREGKVFLIRVSKHFNGWINWDMEKIQNWNCI